MTFLRRLQLRGADRQAEGRSRVRYRLYLEELESRQLLSGTLATVELTPGWATFGQVLPRGAAYDGLHIEGLQTQNDIKSYWDDGSIRFVILTAQVPKSGSYEVTAGSAGACSFIPQLPDAYVRLTISGVQYTATLPGKFEYYDRWLSGSQVMEGRSVVTPARATGQEHPFLRVYFDFRGYRSGENVVDVTVENTLDTAGARAVTYNVSIVVSGQARFQQSNVTHSYMTRWRKVIDSPADFRSEVRSDFEPAFQAGALPRFLPIVTDDEFYVGGPDFCILGPGLLNRDMTDHGSRAEIAPYPDWTARYLVHGLPSHREYVLAHGDLAGSWPVHIRETDGSLVSIDARPDYWLDLRAAPWNRPAGNLDERGHYDPTTGRGLTPDNAHQPSLAYVPYLVTGDRYYADEMAFWANYVLILTWQEPHYNMRGGGHYEGPGTGTPRHPGSHGLLLPNQTRGFGWGLRNLIDAAAYLPDADPFKPYFAEKVVNNLVWLDEYAKDGVGPLGVAWHGNEHNIYFDPEYTRAWTLLWSHNYVAWAIDHANKQGLWGGLLWRDQVAQFQIALLNNPTTRDGAAPYFLPIGDRSGAEIAWYTTLEETYQGRTDYAGYYGVDARLMVMIGVENGWEGADEAYAYLHPQLAVEPHIKGVPDLARRAGWALDI
jgi:hypothetical protein